MGSEFNDRRFQGLSWRPMTQSYLTMNRVSDNGSRVVVKVADRHLLHTKSNRYILILDRTHVIFLPEWCVSVNYYGNEVILDESYWKVEEWGAHKHFSSMPECLEFSYWKEIAEVQQGWIDENGRKMNPVRWKIEAFPSRKQ